MASMTNPFEDNESQYVVLINAERQHSLWPLRLDVPAGWTIVYPASSRQSCLDFIDENWTDMRPYGLTIE